MILFLFPIKISNLVNFFEKLLNEKKLINFSDKNFVDGHHFLLKNNFSIYTKKFSEVMYENLKEKVSFQIGVKIKRLTEKEINMSF